ncbi:MAG TPA: hypothetical protein VLT92_12835 [Burkholderiales bacterium]|nr:hypothetical protein [Burkholderiales bacterium]
MNIQQGSAMLAHKFRRLSHLDLPGGGQVVVQGNYAFVGHMKPPHGTTILDISDPRKPRVVAEIKLDRDRSHTHKVRVAGNVMITNVEHNNRRVVRKAQRMIEARAGLERALGRKPSQQEVAARLGLKEPELAPLEAELASGYDEGGFKVWDIANPAKPRLLAHQKTGGVGVHRFDSDQRYAYISTEMEGYLGNILVIYDLNDPRHPAEVSRWWMPGQHVAGGEQPTWPGQDHRLHHTLREGDKLWAGCWQAGLRVIDVSDITKPRTVGAYNYHPLYLEPTHTVFKVPFKVGGREVALVTDEEHEHHRGQPHACMWVFDVTDLNHIHPIGQFHVSEMDSPWSRTPGGRFGCHQFQEHLSDTLVFCTWFAGGLRVIDIRDPQMPQETGWFIPEPCGGFPSPQSNDVDVDGRGLIYLLDRNCGFDILEYQP